MPRRGRGRGRTPRSSNPNEPGKQQEQTVFDKLHAEANSLVVRNLDRSVTLADIQKHFLQYGNARVDFMAAKKSALVVFNDQSSLISALRWKEHVINGVAAEVHVRCVPLFENFQGSSAFAEYLWNYERSSIRFAEKNCIVDGKLSKHSRFELTVSSLTDPEAAEKVERILEVNWLDPKFCQPVADIMQRRSRFLPLRQYLVTLDAVYNSGSVRDVCRQLSAAVDDQKVCAEVNPEVSWLSGSGRLRVVSWLKHGPSGNCSDDPDLVCNGQRVVFSDGLLADLSGCPISISSFALGKRYRCSNASYVCRTVASDDLDRGIPQSYLNNAFVYLDFPERRVDNWFDCIVELARKLINFCSCQPSFSCFTVIIPNLNMYGCFVQALARASSDNFAASDKSGEKAMEDHFRRVCRSSDVLIGNRLLMECGTTVVFHPSALPTACDATVLVRKETTPTPRPVPPPARVLPPPRPAPSTSTAPKREATFGEKVKGFFRKLFLPQVNAGRLPPRSQPSSPDVADEVSPPPVPVVPVRPKPKPRVEVVCDQPSYASYSYRQLNQGAKISVVLHDGAQLGVKNITNVFDKIFRISVAKDFRKLCIVVNSSSYAGNGE